eukprot:PhF_6_TR36196/c0_g1_i3/m.52778
MSLELESSATDMRAQQAAEEAKILVNRAQEECPSIESRLKYLADRTGGQLIGLEFKIKPLASLERKMLKMWNSGMTIVDVSNAQYDVLRFTMLIPAPQYTSGVKTVLGLLRTEEGCTAVEEKNYWQCHTYRGLNTIYKTKSGLKFELQFHTPESFDQKQFKTHLLYEALRKAENPVTQNVYFMDMMSLWDSVVIPPEVETLGTLTKQELPKPKHVTDEEQATINRIWSVRQQLRDHVQELQNLLNSIADNVTAFVLYLCSVNHVTAKNLAKRVKGALSIRRKVEEEARRLCNISGDLEAVQYPDFVNGETIEKVLRNLCMCQSDALRYKVVCDEARYFDIVCNFFDILTQNGFVVDNVDNYWGDQEKHSAVTATILIPTNSVHSPGLPVRFQIQFHTSDSFRLSEERKVVMENIENAVYKDGSTYNKVSVDMCTRYDHRLMRQWAKVKIPNKAMQIGKQRSVDLTEVESVRHRPWSTPAQTSARVRLILVQSATLLTGVAIGICAAKFGHGIEFLKPQRKVKGGF